MLKLPLILIDCFHTSGSCYIHTACKNIQKGVSRARPPTLMPPSSLTIPGLFMCVICENTEACDGWCFTPLLQQWKKLFEHHTATSDKCQFVASHSRFPLKKPHNPSLFAQVVWTQHKHGKICWCLVGWGEDLHTLEPLNRNTGLCTVTKLFLL